MSDAEMSDAPTPRRRRQATAAPVDGDAVNVELIRNGEWMQVLKSIGSTEYNRLRLIALK